MANKAPPLQAPTTDPAVFGAAQRKIPPPHRAGCKNGGPCCGKISKKKIQQIPAMCWGTHFFKTINIKIQKSIIILKIIKTTVTTNAKLVIDKSKQINSMKNNKII